MTTRERSVKNTQLIKKTSSGLMTKSDYLRINLLFAKWRNWLYYITAVYLFVFFIWSRTSDQFNNFCCPRDNAAEKLGFGINKWRIPILVISTAARGIVFCADGIVSSWLKAPFGQITYSINRSGVEADKSDKIVTLLTEINEHFKETFKKFGVFTIASDISKIMGRMMNRSPDNRRQLDLTNHVSNQNAEAANNATASIAKQSAFTIELSNYGNFMSASLLVPILLAIVRMREAKKLIEGLKFKSEDEYNQ